MTISDKDKDKDKEKDKGKDKEKDRDNNKDTNNNANQGKNEDSRKKDEKHIDSAFQDVVIIDPVLEDQKNTGFGSGGIKKKKIEFVSKE